MGKIQHIQDVLGADVYPVTHLRGVFNDDGDNLEEILENFEPSGGGATVAITGIVSSVNELPSSGSAGDAYLIGDDLYVWVGAGNGDSGTPSTAWHNAGPIRGPQGVGFGSVSSSQDGTLIITLTNGDTITIDLNHNHPAYPKYELLASETAYDAITTKESDKLYLIIESQSS